MKSVSLEELNLLDPQINLIDIRESYRYQMGSIPRSINIPSSFLMAMPEKYLDASKRYYLFCEYGSKSRKIVQYLNQLGYDVWNIEGGYQTYLKDR